MFLTENVLGDDSARAHPKLLVRKFLSRAIETYDHPDQARQTSNDTYNTPARTPASTQHTAMQQQHTARLNCNAQPTYSSLLGVV